MAIEVPSVSDQTVKSLVNDIETKGFGCLPSFVRPEDLDRMRSFVSTAINRSGGQYVGFTGVQSMEGSTLEEFGQSSAFADLFRRIYEMGTGRSAPRVEFYQVLRCLSGQSGQKHSLIFHYDSYVVTALIPVEIPKEGMSGDLIMLPNTRGIRKTYTANVVDKILLDNRFTQWVLRTMLKHGLLRGLTRIKMVPGNIYFFWGYRSIHTNEACDPDKVRATALFHYANPHAGMARGFKVRAPAMQ